MIKTENLSDGRIHTYSDAGLKIMQETGIVYEDAVDTVAHTYTETDELIEDEDTEATAEDLEAALEEVL